MSRTAASTEKKRGSSYSPRIGSKTRINIDNRVATIEVTEDGDYEARVEVDLDRRWKFGVRTDGIAELLGTFEDGRQVGTSVPDWMEWVLRQVGLEGMKA